MRKQAPLLRQRGNKKSPNQPRRSDPTVRQQKHSQPRRKRTQPYGGKPVWNVGTGNSPCLFPSTSLLRIYLHLGPRAYLRGFSFGLPSTSTIAAHTDCQNLKPPLRAADYCSERDSGHSDLPTGPGPWRAMRCVPPLRWGFPLHAVALQCPAEAFAGHWPPGASAGSAPLP
jgi:hypothetical protein